MSPESFAYPATNYLCGGCGDTLFVLPCLAKTGFELHACCSNAECPNHGTQFRVAATTVRLVPIPEPQVVEAYIVPAEGQPA